jgi:predicted alpha/beta hydrolase family esterase
MRTADVDILILPGLGGSDPDHWQTRWEAKLPTARRVNQSDWDRPKLQAWRDRLIEEVERAERPVLLVAHSLGATTVAHAAPYLRDLAKVKGALLVAPPSVEMLKAFTAIDPAFGDPQAGTLPFPALVIASRDDPMAPYGDSERFAKILGAELVDAGLSGHINSESGHGPWPEGLMRFAGFLKNL